MKIPVRNSLLLFGWLFTCPVLAQKIPAVSARADSLQVISLLNTGRPLIVNMQKKGRDQFIQALHIVERKHATGYLQHQVELLNRLATFYMLKGSHDSAVYYNMLLHQLGESKKNRLVMARADLGFGNIAEYRSDYEGAVTNNMRALSYFESVKDTFGIAAASGNIGNAYIRLQQFTKAVTYLNRAVGMYTGKKVKRSIANNMSSLARAYKGLGNKQKELDLKLRALALFKEDGYKKGIATVAMNLGAYYTGENNPGEALNYFNVALENSWQINDSGNIGTLHSQMADLYLRTKQLDLAGRSIDSALHYTQKSGDRLTQSEGYLLKAAFLSAAGDLAGARAASGRGIELRDSIYTARMQSKVADMEVKYETTKKESQIRNNELQLHQNKMQLTEQEQALLISRLQLKNKDQALVNQQLDAEKKAQNIRSLQKQSRIQALVLDNQALSLRQRNYTIGIIIIVVLASAALLYSWYNRKQLRQKALIQQQVLYQQGQMSQAVIDAEEKERKRIAGDLHDGVGQLFSAVRMNLDGLFGRLDPVRAEDRFLFEKTIALVEESCKEVRVISHQMMPNMLLRSGVASDVQSFIEKLDSENLKVNLVATGFSNRMESNVETVLYRVIQETVNNVIKHARATVLDIRLERDASGISAGIADNGVGFNTRLSEDFAGIGLKNIAARIEYLKGTVSYESGAGKGTKVLIWVPVG